MEQIAEVRATTVPNSLKCKYWLYNGNHRTIAKAVFTKARWGISNAAKSGSILAE